MCVSFASLDHRYHPSREEHTIEDKVTGVFQDGLFPAGLFPAGLFPARSFPRRYFLRHFVLNKEFNWRQQFEQSVF